MIVKYDGQLVQRRCRWLRAMVNICDFFNRFFFMTIM